jgi:hypothetical protein
MITKKKTKLSDSDLYAAELQKRPRESLSSTEKTYLFGYTLYDAKIVLVNQLDLFTKMLIIGLAVLWSAYLIFQRDGGNEFFPLFFAVYFKACLSVAAASFVRGFIATMLRGRFIRAFRAEYPTPDFIPAAAEVQRQEPAGSATDKKLIASELLKHPDSPRVEPVSASSSSVTDSLEQTVLALGSPESGRVLATTVNAVSVAGSGQKYLIYVLLETPDGKALPSNESMEYRALVRKTVLTAAENIGAGLSSAPQVEFIFRKP